MELILNSADFQYSPCFDFSKVIIEKCSLLKKYSVYLRPCISCIYSYIEIFPYFIDCDSNVPRTKYKLFSYVGNSLKSQFKYGQFQTLIYH